MNEFAIPAVWGTCTSAAIGLVKMILGFFDLDVNPSVLRYTNLILAGLIYWIVSTAWWHQNPVDSLWLAIISVLVSAGTYDTIGQPASKLVPITKMIKGI